MADNNKNKSKKEIDTFLATDSTSCSEAYSIIAKDNGESLGKPELLKEMEDYLAGFEFPRLVGQDLSIYTKGDPKDNSEKRNSQFGTDISTLIKDALGKKPLEQNPRKGENE